MHNQTKIVRPSLSQMDDVIQRPLYEKKTFILREAQGDHPLHPLMTAPHQFYYKIIHNKSTNSLININLL